MIPLKEILQEFGNRYKLTVAAIKTYPILSEHPELLTQEEKKNKLALVTLKKVLSNQIEILEKEEKK